MANVVDDTEPSCVSFTYHLCVFEKLSPAIAGYIIEPTFYLGLAPQALCLRLLSQAKSIILRLLCFFAALSITQRRSLYYGPQRYFAS